jgi:nitroreductase
VDVKEAIKKRRSIRKYTDKPVSDETVRELLEAARLAPSGCNAQPWRFFIVNNTSTMKKLREKSAFQQAFVYRAPLVLVCCGDPGVYQGKYGGEYQVEEGSVPKSERDRKKMFSIVEGREPLRAVRDVSIASGFLVLRATELGLGTSYIGLIKEQVLKEVLHIPDEFVIPFVIAAGYYSVDPVPRQTNELNEIVISNSLED